MLGMELKKREFPFEKNVKQLLRKFQHIRSFITVEPTILCYILPSVLSGLAVQTLCLEKACLVDLNYSNETCAHIMSGKTENYTLQEKEVQKLVASVTGWSFPLQTAIPGLLILFVGAWSDRTHNRKSLMVLPILGKLISIIAILFSTYFFMNFGLAATALLEGLPPALAGGRVAMTMAVYSYISDITTEKERTFRLGIVTAFLTLSRPIGLSLSGIMTKYWGYYGVFSIVIFMYVIGFVYTKINIKDVVRPMCYDTKEAIEEKQNSTTIFDVLSFEHLASTLRVAFQKRAGTKRIRIILVLIAHMLMVGPIMGESQMAYWFARYRFKFSEIEYSLFLTYTVIVVSIGSAMSIYLFSKRWQMDDCWIGVIAGVSRVLGTLVYALAPSRSVFFIGPLLDVFGTTAATALRAIIASLVDPEDYGKAGSLVGISEALVPVIYSPVYSKVYLATLTTFPGAFYLISTFLTVLAIFIFILIYLLQKERKPTSEVQDTHI